MEEMASQAKLNYLFSRKLYYPDLMVKVSSRRKTGAEFGTRELGVSLNLPLWFWKKQKNIVAAKKIKWEEAKNLYQAAKNELSFKINSFHTKIQTAKKQFDRLKEVILPQAEACLLASVKNYETGKIDFLSLIDSQKMLLKVKWQYFQCLGEYFKNLAKLEKITGEVVKNE
jgi:cobalt-zinc-cadmium efflux system outer membrane protein